MAGADVNRQDSYSVKRAFRGGHPAPRLYYIVMAGLWTWFSYSASVELAHHAGVIDRLMFATFTVLFAAFVLLSLRQLVIYKARCKAYHAAEALITKALYDLPVDSSVEKEIMEERRG
jgi:uncharacterized membrane protein YqjE